MKKIRNTQEIRQFLLSNIDSKNLVSDTVSKFGITRAAVYRHLKQLTEQNIIQHNDAPKGRRYRLISREYRFSYDITDGLSESTVWSTDIAPLVPKQDNISRIWEHGFTEMFNNAIDHSQGTKINVLVRVDAVNTTIIISDNGIGIFRNIKNRFNLQNEREALLELSKGKLTTDRKKHSGEGIFFTSRIFDMFIILSYDISFSHNDNAKSYQDIFLEQKLDNTDDCDGTSVLMRLSNNSKRKLLDVFNTFSVDDEYSFDKTLIPIELARYGDDNLISRSQAKRVMARIDLFKSVILDFKDVPYIGQAFADEIFRVFANEHPDIEILVINANEEVSKMISRAKNVRL